MPGADGLLTTRLRTSRAANIQLKIKHRRRGALRSFHVILSGCSGGGKSTLLKELSRRGFANVSEPGRRIVGDEMRGDGAVLPWVDLAAFAKRAIDLAAVDKKRATNKTGWVFFDRGLVDAAVALEHATGRSVRQTLAPFERYHHRVFLTPPWPEIYVKDDERQHSLSEAVTEYDRLVIAYRELEYETIIVPKISVEQRADFVLHRLT